MFKKLLIMLIAAVCCAGAQAQIVKGEKTLGIKTGYVSRNSSAVAGLMFQYNLSSKFRIAPEVGCAFRHKDKDALLIDINLHRPFSLAEDDKVLLYPLVGLAFNSWSKHWVSETDGDDVSNHTNRFGANLGAGFDLRCSGALRLNIEAKYTFVKSYCSAFVTAGISYVF